MLGRWFFYQFSKTTRAESKYTLSKLLELEKKNASKRAEIIFPVSRVANYLRNGHYAKRFSKAASVYLAAAIEYLISEILELAGKHTKEFKLQHDIFN